MEKIKIVLAKIGYGALFVCLLPTLLVFWARYTEVLIRLPIPLNPYLAYFLFVMGLCLVFLGMGALWIKGKGLPMNAFPPLYFVQTGVYGLFHHPIYVGSVMACFGFSMITGSSAGFWLVSPLFTLMVIAYVVGFENEKIRGQFGKTSHTTRFDVPPSTNQKASISEKLRLYIWVYLPWLGVYELFVFLGVPKDAISTHLPLDEFIPFRESSVLAYSFVYLYAFFVPWVLQSQKDVFQFFRQSLWGMILIGMCYLCFPFVAEQQDITSSSFFTDWILWERGMDSKAAALPSYHVFWAWIAAQYCARRFPKMAILHYFIAVVISISCLTTGNHTILDVVTGWLVWLVLRDLDKTWNYLQRFFEKIANDWKEWHFGSIRLINHGFYAGLAGMVGSWMMASLLGDTHISVIFVIGIAGIVGAALWAQFVEGSPMLLRPYGYYGSVLGVPLGCVVASMIFGKSANSLIAITIMAAPWIQCIGRLRCLVQGCCHGKLTEGSVGICFHHPKSRVNKMAGWSGKRLYPTQIYSIGANFFIGLLLLRLVHLGMPVNFITGMYLILNGLSRFVEEHFRGEPQTPYFWGMRVYQWLALASIVAGGLFTCLKTLETLQFQGNIQSLWVALGFGVLTTIAYGVDFPKSNQRFSRLSG